MTGQRFLSTGLQNVTKVGRYLAYSLLALKLHKKYGDRTMIQLDQFVDNLVIAGARVRSNKEISSTAAVIECGTWKGGMAGAMMELFGPNRPYCFFDSFEGLPPAKEIDGPGAIAWQANTESEAYYDNCTSTVETFFETISRSGIELQNVDVIPGFFEHTLATFESPDIALLRLDADWYDSTMVCLRKFWDHVVPGGIVLIDDYFGWDGCSRAVHDFLSERKTPARIHQGRIAGVAYIVKE